MPCRALALPLTLALTLILTRMFCRHGTKTPISVPSCARAGARPASALLERAALPLSAADGAGESALLVSCRRKGSFVSMGACSG